MKPLKTIVLAGVIFITLTGCTEKRSSSSDNPLPLSSSPTASPTDERLTAAKAESALNKWTGSHGAATVKGVREVPRDNSARADISLTDYHFTSKDAFLGDAPKIYTGPGTAIFVRYNDGRWMLSKVAFTMRGGMMFTFDTINIEAR